MESKGRRLFECGTDKTLNDLDLSPSVIKEKKKRADEVARHCLCVSNKCLLAQ